MNRHYRKSRRSRLSRQAGKLFPSIALVVVGCAIFYLALQWFRQDAEHDPVQAEEAHEAVASGITDTSVSISQDITVPLVSAYDGQHTGRVQRFFNHQGTEMMVLAYLPNLDMAADSYHVWLLKDGLADVKDMGQLVPRADGSWVLNFVAGPTTGIVDPRVYKSIVIMREPNDGNTAPSGQRIAEAKF